MPNQPVGRIQEALEPAVPALWELAIYGVGLGVLIWLIVRIKAWFRDDDAGTGRNNDLLTDLRELHREGGLSDEEFRLIKTRLIGSQTGNSTRVPNPAKTAETVAPPTVPPTATETEAQTDAQTQTDEQNQTDVVPEDDTKA